MFCHLDNRLGIVVRHGFLEPSEPKRLQFSANPNGSRNAEAGMGFDGELDIRADRIAHGGHNVERECLLLGWQNAETSSKRIEFERCISDFDGVARGDGDRFRLTLAAIPSVRISAYPVPAPPSEQVINGLVQRLSDSVPTGDFYGRDGA